MADNSNNSNNGDGFNVEISKKIAQGVYSNLAIITHSSSEFIIDFLRVMPGLKPQAKSRIVLTPDHAKRLLLALQDNVAKYEASMGPIKLGSLQQEPQMPPFPMNFGGNKGEA